MLEKVLERNTSNEKIEPLDLHYQLKMEEHDYLRNKKRDRLNDLNTSFKKKKSNQSLGFDSNTRSKGRNIDDKLAGHRGLTHKLNKDLSIQHLRLPELKLSHDIDTINAKRSQSSL